MLKEIETHPDLQDQYRIAQQLDILPAYWTIDYFRTGSVIVQTY
ncbi:hypothetical protein P4S72_15575 [Vibrio sp. PP-XX7]